MEAAPPRGRRSPWAARHGGASVRDQLHPQRPPHHLALSAELPYDVDLPHHPRVRPRPQKLAVYPSLTRSARTSDMLDLHIVAGTSFGTHESQSRVLENYGGRSSAFQAVPFPRLRGTFT